MENRLYIYIKVGASFSWWWWWLGQDLSDPEKPTMSKSREESIPGCKKFKCKDRNEINMSHERKAEVGSMMTRRGVG